MIRGFGIDRAAAAIFALGVLALCPVYLAAVRLPAFGLFHDDGIYLITAQSIAEGRGYHITSLPSEPRQTKYPPVFPLLLATVTNFSPAFPRNLLWLKLVPLIGSVAWLWLSLRLLKRLGISISLRALACFATAAAPWVVYLSATLLSETIFAALCTGALLCLETDEPPSLKRVILAGALAALATLTRTAGLSLVVAGTAWLLLIRGRPRHAALFAGIAVACLAPWWIWVSQGDASGYYGAANYVNWNVLAPGNSISLSQRAKVVATNLAWIAVSGPALLGGPVNPLMLIVAAALLGVGFWRVLPQKRATAWFVMAYLTLIALWAWPPQRFVIVILPLLIWLALAAVARSTIVTSTLVVALTIGGAQSLRAGYRGIDEGKRTGDFGANAAIENWADVETLGQWLRVHTATDRVLIGNLDPLYYLLTGRKSVRAFEADPFQLFYAASSSARPLGTSESLLSRIKAVDAAFVIDAPDGLYAEGPWLKRQIGELESRGDLQMVETIGEFRILRPRPD